MDSGKNANTICTHKSAQWDLKQETKETTYHRYIYRRTKGVWHGPTWDTHWKVKILRNPKVGTEVVRKLSKWQAANGANWWY